MATRIVLLIAVLASPAAAERVVLSQFQTIQIGSRSSAGGTDNFLSMIRTGTPAWRGLHVWSLPRTPAIQNAYLILRFLATDTNEFNVVPRIIPNGAALTFDALDDGQPIAASPVSRAPGTRSAAIPFSSESIAWLESQKAFGLNKLSLSFSESGIVNVSTSEYVILNQTFITGDANGDGAVDNLDIAGFAAGVLGNADAYEGLTGLPLGFMDLDIDQSRAVNNLDVAPFVSMLSGGSAAVPEPSTLALLVIAGLLLAHRMISSVP